MRGQISKEEIKSLYTHGVIKRINKEIIWVYLDIYPKHAEVLGLKGEIKDYLPLPFDIDAVSLDESKG